MMDKDDDQELATIAARAADIRAGLDAGYSTTELKGAVSRRLLHALVAASTAATAVKLGALAARLEEVELDGIRYSGCYQRALEYRKGSVVTFASSMWVALDDVPAGVQPGSNTAAWQLSQKGQPWARKQTEGGR
ncbi:hypothetical protein [Rhizobium giardinii]|uniref:Uncharacterized protein n=1 Tax=Rhizobium giardinii TaxID=56731 RepID=A0A7W8UA68_9HYPH|nr:hypothetical protein [Rhizobium giardinii]MBB5535044.1 hypothetical protein [Rhizobium giardinii]